MSAIDAQAPDFDPTTQMIDENGDIYNMTTRRYPGVGFVKTGTGYEPVTEEELIEKATAPRITEADLKNNIIGEAYFTATDGVLGAAIAEDRHYHTSKQAPFKDSFYTKQADDVAEMEHRVSLETLTFCILLLKNGYTVVGQSACANPANFDREIGRRLARQDAEKKIWPLMGYALREDMHRSAEQAKVLAYLAEVRERIDELQRNQPPIVRG